MGALPDIERIEMGRVARGIPIGQLCRVAAIPRSTYSRLRAKPQSGRLETLRRLEKALHEITQIRSEANGNHRA